MPTVNTRVPAPRGAGVAAATVRRAVAEFPLRPYEVLQSGDRCSENSRAVADVTMAYGWAMKGFPPVELSTPIAWDDLCAANRSWAFHLHCWDPLAPVLATYQALGEGRYLDFAAEVALDWVRQYPRFEPDGDSFAWYDMAVGVRAYRLAYILDCLSREHRFPDEMVAALVDAVVVHAEALESDDLFPGHSNHGLYFAAGQAALARRFPMLTRMRRATKLANRRLRDIVHAHFTSEGVHKEHSPDYHRMVLETVFGLREAGLLAAAGLDDAVDEIQEALAWFVLPSGHLATFGDTPRRSIVGLAGDHWGTDSLRFVVSAGAEGTPPADNARTFPESGYVVFRDGWPAGEDDFADWSYLAQTCAFHSRTHKHADDLSFVWYERGAEILVDPGRYGYRDPTVPGSELWNQGFWYGDPARVYVESTRSHNTVEIDGGSFPRRTHEPYGSALNRWGEYAGVHYSESTRLRWNDVGHLRMLFFRPGEWVLVLDDLVDETGGMHALVQRFHFAPEIELSQVADSLELALADGRSLFVAPLLPAEILDPVRGQAEPELLGWVSREDGQMTPCWTVGLSADGVAGHRFATLLSLGSMAPVPVADDCVAEEDLRRGVLAWWDGAATHVLRFSRPRTRPVRIEYEIALGDA